MLLRRLWLTDFRSYTDADLTLAPGITVVVGDNGQGKSNLVEAIGYLATLSSFRGAPTDALIRDSADMSVVRAEGDRGGRSLLIEATIARTGRNKVLVNKQRLTRTRDLLGALRVTVFAPDDLKLVKDGPAARRHFLDEALVALHPKHDALRVELDRILRQRNALLKQVGGRLTPDVEITLDVWDAKLAQAGEALVAERIALLERLGPLLADFYDRVAATEAKVTVDYLAEWRAGGLAEALVQARRDDLRRGLSTVGPHRDDVVLAISGMPSRTHASQGEQRSLALALRLAAHHVVTESVGSPPILVLDDVFSELDPGRSAALIANLPSGQTLLTAAGALPGSVDADVIVHIDNGSVRKP